ncbi:hypothetical protein N9N67_11110 [Bacteriovoracaceae bacterium]|nr:hypothetical protein [Bacteriovoracaceae bacterium]
MSFILVKGIVFNPLSDEKYEFFPNGYILFNRSKKQIVAYGDFDRDREKNSLKGIPKVYDFSGHLIIPPFFDMHFHWVQDKVRTKSKSNLLDWLHRHTFPQEDKFSCTNYSLKEAERFFKKLSAQGTLGGAIFCSIHEHTLKHALKFAQGNFIAGNVLMTQNSPDYLLQDKREAKKLVSKLSNRFKNNYAFTPRFAISCDMETMKLGHDLSRA